MSEYYKTKDSVEEYISLAKDVNGAALIKKLINFLPLKSTLLELGSGPGTDWKILSQSYKVVGSDFSKEFLDHLRANNSGATFLELDASTLNTSEVYDGIYSNKVLHHLTNEQLQNSMKRQYEILTDGGIICNSFWKGEGSEEFKGMFVNYHTEDELRKVFHVSFEILLLENYAEFEEGDSILLIARKKTKD